MHSLRAYIAGTSVLLACGCAAPEVERERPINAYLVKSVQRTAADNAIIDQHTLFPYHFVKESAELTASGRADLALLASHFRRFPGALNVRRNGAEQALHEARVKTVTDYLATNFVEMEKMRISDGLPGGDGMDSERVGTIMSLDLANIGVSSESSSSGAGSSMSSSGGSGAAAQAANPSGK